MDNFRSSLPINGHSSGGGNKSLPPPPPTLFSLKDQSSPQRLRSGSDSEDSSCDPMSLDRAGGPSVDLNDTLNRGANVPFSPPATSAPFDINITHNNNERGAGGRGASRAPTIRSIIDDRQFEIGGDESNKMSHLPTVKGLGPTSYSNWDVVHELEFTIGKVLGTQVLDDIMKDRGAYDKFREFVAGRSESNPIVCDLYHDLRVFADLSSQLRVACKAIEEVYLLKDSPLRLALPINIRGPLLESLRMSSTVGKSMAGPQSALLSTLFESDFQAYVQQRLVEHAVSRLGSVRLNPYDTGSPERDGLADCYCLTNPKLHDNPITLASEGFAQLTGYELNSIIGRNCPGTSTESTLRLRKALDSGNGITSLLLNYRRSGEPFFNLLCMLPLKDQQGNVKYFLGGQIDVTGSIQSIIDQASTDDGFSSVRGPTRPHFTSTVQSHAYDITSNQRRQNRANGNSVAVTKLLEIRKAPSITTLESGNSRSSNGLADAIKKKASWKAAKGSDLGLTPEEHMAMNGGTDASRLVNKIAEFEATYSRVMLIAPDREILFVTPEVAQFCGVPESQTKELIGTNFSKLVHGVSKEDDKRLRRNIRSAMDNGHAYAVPLGLKLQLKTRYLIKSNENVEPKHCVVHMTPLLNQTGVVVAYVVVFGAV